MRSQPQPPSRSPLWAALLVVLCGGTLLTQALGCSGWCSSYLVDAAGPAWTYILARGLFTEPRDNTWTRVFRPARTLLVCLAAVFLIEVAQAFDLYDSTYDPWDFLAYVSLIVPVFLLDLRFDGR